MKGLVGNAAVRLIKIQENPMATTADTRTWPELAIGLYDQLTERNAEIAYQFENLEVGIPSAADAGAQLARWHLNGTLRVTTRNAAKA